MPEALSAHDLAYMRQIAVDLLPDTCTIELLTDTADAYGGVARTWATAYSNIACRVDEIHGSPVVGADWMVTLPWDQTFTLSHRIVTGTLTLEPVELNTGRSWKAATRVWCRRVED